MFWAALQCLWIILNLISTYSLKIQNGKHHAEGDYQCSALIRGVRLSNGKHIDTRLVSAPVKFRRARITKFEEVAPQVLSPIFNFFMAISFLNLFIRFLSTIEDR